MPRYSSERTTWAFWIFEVAVIAGILGLAAYLLKGIQMSHSYEIFRKAVNQAAMEKGEWAGVPVPIDGTPMVLHPKYPLAEAFKEKHDPTYDNHRIINSWFCSKMRSWLYIWRDPEEKLHWGVLAENIGATSIMNTLSASRTWDFEAEITACKKLRTLIPRHLFEMYQMTGMFLEFSKRSGLFYVFRKLRPTIVLSPRGRNRIQKEGMRVLCCLCMHPIGYYKESWAGSLVPTDDVLAHLLLMRADEVYYWKKCNQIPAERPESGIFG